MLLVRLFAARSGYARTAAVWRPLDDSNVVIFRQFLASLAIIPNQRVSCIAPERLLVEAFAWLARGAFVYLGSTKRLRPQPCSSCRVCRALRFV